MGANQCSCLKGKDDVVDIKFEIRDDEAIRPQPQAQEPTEPQEEAPSELLRPDVSEDHSKQLLGLQSLVRGYLTRKVVASEFAEPEDQSEECPYTELSELPPKALSAYASAKFSERGAYQFVPHSLPGLRWVGPVRYEDGKVYIGDVNSQGLPHGNGTAYFVDGSICEGQWRHGMLNGWGRRISADGDVYLGNWKNNMKSGHGEIDFRFSESRYVGNWENDIQHGYGEEFWPYGAKFEGNFVAGSKEGKGKFVWSDGSVYEGEFQNNQIEGHGTYKWANGTEYTGQWLENKMHGKGTFKWGDGRLYDGEYVMDQKQGFGVMTWPGGRCYEGEWKDGKMAGRGKLTDSKGKVRDGWWENGKLVKKISADSPAGELAELEQQ